LDLGEALSAEAKLRPTEGGGKDPPEAKSFGKSSAEDVKRREMPPPPVTNCYVSILDRVCRGRGADMMQNALKTSGPYDELHVYEVEGRLEGFPHSWSEEGFLGCWYEGDYSFLFFCAPREGLVRGFLDGRPEARLRTAVVLPYEEWEAGGPLRPFRVGPLWVLPPWDGAEPQAGEQVIVLDPGVCFGSGHHPSTRACLDLLVGLYGRARPRRVLDLGTGTGILALAAARLGAERVLAVDLQPLAVETALANVRRNGLEDVVEVRLADAAQLLGEPSDLILANLSYDLICRLLERPWRGTGCWWIFSGVVGAQVERLKERLASLALKILEVRGENFWFSVLASSARQGGNVKSFVSGPGA